MTDANTPGRRRRLPLLEMGEIAPIYALVATTIALAVVGRPRFDLEQWWIALAFAVVFVLQIVFRIDRGNSLRRRDESLAEISLVVALFWLSPAWLLVTRLVAVPIGLRLLRYPRAWIVYNTSHHVTAISLMIAITAWIHPVGPLDGYRALMVALAVWLINDTIEIAAIPVVAYARWRRFNSGQLRQAVTTAPIRILAVAFGLLIAMALAASPWSLLPVAALGMLFVRVGSAESRLASLESGIVQMTHLSEQTARADSPEAVEDAVIEAIRAFAGFNTYAVVTPAPARRLRWRGVVRPGAVDELASIDAVAALDGRPAELTEARTGIRRVWSIDAERSSFLVVESLDTSANLDDLWDTIGQFAEHARLAIDTVRTSARLAETARRERERSRTDPLTSLPNRLAVDDEIERWLRPSPSATGVEQPFAIVLASLFGYDELVDVLGPDTADAATVDFAERLQTLSGVDSVARVGASTFLLIVPGDLDTALRVARAAAVPSADDATRDSLGDRDASVGIAAVSVGASLTADKLVRRAGLALEQSQRDGEVIVFSPAHEREATRRLAISLKLADAIDGQLVVPVLQPQVDLDTEQVVGVEVLSRWSDPGLGPITPEEYVEVAIQNGQIEQLNLSIGTQAMAAIARWDHDGSVLPVSFNLGGSAFTRPHFVRSLLALAEQSGRGPEMITVELAEDSLARGNGVIDAIHELHDLGIRIALDKFGTGYSVLSFLDQLPIQEIKLHRSMVAQLRDDRPPSPTIRRLFELCHDLDFRVVAEGIETPTQARLLRDLGCRVGQGFLFARPMSPEHAGPWIEPRLQQAA